MDYKSLFDEYFDVLNSLFNFAIYDAKITAVSFIGFAIVGTILAIGFNKFGSGGKNARNTAFPVDLYKSRQTRIDIGVFLLNKIIFMPAIFGLGAMLLGGVAIDRLLSIIFGEAPTAINADYAVLAIQFSAAIIGGELSFYLMHRLMHTSPLLWSIHAVHHSPETLTPFVKSRNHPLEMFLFLVFNTVIGGTLTGLAIYLTGGVFHTSLGVWLLVVRVGTAVLVNFNHSHFNISFGPLDYLVLTPSMHRIHHSAELRHRDLNFGGYLSIFDWMFGTGYRPAPKETYRFGLSEDKLGDANPHQSVKDIYVAPLIELAEAFRDRKSAPVRNQPKI